VGKSNWPSDGRDSAPVAESVDRGRKPRSLKSSPRCCGECKRFPARPEGDWIVLISLNVADERLTTAHRAKLAYVYVRQSSVNQVRQHQESTELQYRLVEVILTARGDPFTGDVEKGGRELDQPGL